jgi:ketosteroid isomerase-like protein
MSNDNSAAQAMNTYFTAWREKDTARLRSVLADDIDFAGPLARITGGDECAKALAGLGQITTDIVVQHVFVDGDDVLTWFDLHTTVADPTPVANWGHVEDGKIKRVRVTFDPRGLAP